MYCDCAPAMRVSGTTKDLVLTPARADRRRRTHRAGRGALAEQANGREPRVLAGAAAVVVAVGLPGLAVGGVAAASDKGLNRLLVLDTARPAAEAPEKPQLRSERAGGAERASRGAGAGWEATDFAIIGPQPRACTCWTRAPCARTAPPGSSAGCWTSGRCWTTAGRSGCWTTGRCCWRPSARGPRPRWRTASRPRLARQRGAAARAPWWMKERRSVGGASKRSVY